MIGADGFWKAARLQGSQVVLRTWLGHPCNPALRFLPTDDANFRPRTYTIQMARQMGQISPPATHTALESSIQLQLPPSSTRPSKSPAAALRSARPRLFSSARAPAAAAIGTAPELSERSSRFGRLHRGGVGSRRPALFPH